MAEYGEWGRKGATLSDVTAVKEYGVTRDFIVAGIRAGKLEYREGAAHGNPFLRLLRRQLEDYIAAKEGGDHLKLKQRETELRAVKSRLRALEKEAAVLRLRKDELEAELGARRK